MSLTGENIGENVGEGGDASFLVPPTNLSQLAVTVDSVTLSWTEQPQGSAIGYLIYSAGGGETFYLRATVAYGTSSALIDGLIAATEYTFWVKSYNTYSQSSDSNYLDITTTSVPSNIPTILSIDAIEGSNDVNVNYSESVYTADGTNASYEEDFTFTVSGSTRTPSFNAGSAYSSRLTFTLDGAAFIAGESIALEYVYDVAVPEGVIFSDNFDSGTLNVGIPQNNGFWWKTLNNTSVTTDNPRTGSHSLRFDFNGTGTSWSNSWAEQAYYMGGNYPEIWVRYMIYLPDGTESWGGAKYNRTTTDESGYTSLNHKVNRFWDNDYGYTANPEKMGASSWPETSSSDFSAKVSVEYADEDGGGLLNHYAGVIFSESDLGKWTEFVFNTKIETGLGAADGHFKIWKNGSLHTSKTGITNYTTDRKHYFNSGYLFGAANRGFQEDTIIFIDDFVISTASLL